MVFWDVTLYSSIHRQGYLMPPSTC